MTNTVTKSVLGAKSKSQAKRLAAQEPNFFKIEQRREKIPGVKWALDELYAVNKSAGAFLRGYISGLRFAVEQEKTNPNEKN